MQNAALDPNDPAAIDRLIAYHRSVFGDARMEDPKDGNDEAPPEGESSTTASTDDQSSTSGDSNAPKVKSEDELPEWARTELTRVRGEAANWRTKLREAQDNLAKAKTPEEFEAATTELQTKVTDLEGAMLRSSVAREHNLPDELAARLRGTNEAELKADAKLLQKFSAAHDPATLDGGLTPDSGDDGEMDPHKLARQSRRR